MSLYCGRQFLFVLYFVFIFILEWILPCLSQHFFHSLTPTNNTKHIHTMCDINLLFLERDEPNPICSKYFQWILILQRDEETSDSKIAPCSQETLCNRIGHKQAISLRSWMQAKVGVTLNLLQNNSCARKMT